jgi:hypothetical protein
VDIAFPPHPPAPPAPPPATILILVTMKFVVMFTFVVIPAAVAVPIRFVQVKMLFVLSSEFERAVSPITIFDPGGSGTTNGELTLLAVVDP